MALIRIPSEDRLLRAPDAVRDFLKPFGID
jgi:hypothetical protein